MSMHKTITSAPVEELAAAAARLGGLGPAPTSKRNVTALRKNLRELLPDKGYVVAEGTHLDWDGGSADEGEAVPDAEVGIWLYAGGVIDPAPEE